MNSNIRVTEVTPVHLAAIVEDSGCGGTDTAGYLMYDTPRTRAELIADLAATKAAERAETAAFDAANKLAARPSFDESWSGTHAEYQAALAAHKEASDDYWRRRGALKKAATKQSWDAAGATPFHLVTGYLPTIGGPYDDIECPADINPDATPASYALVVMDHVGCRCGHGGYGYADNASDDDVTTQGWKVTIDRDSTTTTYISHTGDIEVITAAAVAAEQAARGAADEIAADRAKYVQVREMTSAELDEMTFVEFKSWKESVKLTAVQLPVRIVGSDAVREPNWDAELASLTALRRTDTAAAAGLFEIGVRRHRGW